MAILDRAESAVNAVFSLLSEDMGISTTKSMPSENTLLTLFDYAYERKATAADEFAQSLIVKDAPLVPGCVLQRRITRHGQTRRSRRGLGDRPRAEHPVSAHGALLKAMKKRQPLTSPTDRAHDVFYMEENYLRGGAGRCIYQRGAAAPQ